MYEDDDKGWPFSGKKVSWPVTGVWIHSLGSEFVALAKILELIVAPSFIASKGFAKVKKVNLA